ncbi:MAG: type II secretion system protein GspD [Candidatus Omnitrophica bacterium]|nr:type II secretion system protein GspD [Candidatus Omnitrophota bacterium]
MGASPGRGLGALLALAVLAGAAGAARGQVQAQDQPATISMDVTGAYLEDVLKVLSRQAGMNFVASEDVRDKKVTLFFDQVPIFDALGTILKAHHLALKPEEGKNLFLVTESGSPKIATVTRVFQLKFARVLPSAGELFTNFGFTGSLIKQIFSSDESTAATSSATTTTGTPPGGVAPEPGGIVLIVKALLTEHGSVVPDPRTNSLIVTDVPEVVEVVAETIARLDVRPKQVYIEAEILEVTLDTLRRIGLEYGSSDGQVLSYGGLKRTSFFPFSLGLFDGATQSHTLGTLTLFSDASIVFKLLSTESDVKFLARPRLLTLSGEVAEIRIISEAVTGTTSTSQTDTGSITSAPERTTVGTILRVTPLVNDDKYVTMVIEPEVSRVLQSSSFSNFLDPNRRLARTTVMAPNAGTVMIAGLISSENTNSNRRVPGLGDLPLVGLPFKRSTTERKNTEILLFITPHILEDDGARKLLAKEREQAPLSIEEDRALQGHRKRLLRERAIVDTIDSMLR